MFNSLRLICCLIIIIIMENYSDHRHCDSGYMMFSMNICLKGCMNLWVEVTHIE